MPLVAFTIATTSAQAVTIFTEDFDSLTAGSSLHGQGGWSFSQGSNTVTVVADPGRYGFSGNIASGPSDDSQYTHAIPAGLNDVNNATFSFDTRINGASHYTYWHVGSVSFGVEYGNIVIRGTNADSVYYAHGQTVDNNYHLTMTIDPTAYSNAGSATLTFAQYTAENTLGTEITAFTNIELKLDEGSNALSDINLSVLRIFNGMGDNMIITQPVPEPSSTALLGLGCLALIFRRRK